MAREFVPPTVEEIQEYSFACGYEVDAQEFISFYEHNDWRDSNDRPIKNWKLKLRNVWFKNARQIKPAKNAPPGFEKWYVKDQGVFYFPTEWRNGKPFSDDGIVADMMLQQAYKEQKKK